VPPAVAVFPPPSGFAHGPLPWLCSGGPWCITRNLCVSLSVTTLKSHGPHLTRIGPQAKTESLSLSCLSLPNQTMFCTVMALAHCLGVGAWNCVYIYGMDTVVRGLYPRPYCQSIGQLMIGYTTNPPLNPPDPLSLILNPTP
jgi:hypothetical protein